MEASRSTIYLRIEILCKEKLLEFIISVYFDLNSYFEYKPLKMEESRKQQRTELVRVLRSTFLENTEHLVSDGASISAL